MLIWISIYLLLYTHPFLTALLRHIETQNKLWCWEGSFHKFQKRNKGLKALFCKKISFLRGGFPPFIKFWCRSFYQRVCSNTFQIVTPLDDDGDPIYDFPSDDNPYKKGIYGDHLLTPFYCNLCIKHDNKVDIEK